MTPKILALISIAIGVFPLLVALLGQAVAKILGCRVDEGNAQKCMFCGVDIGGILYATLVFHWLVLMTGPIAMLGIIGSVIWWFFG